MTSQDFLDDLWGDSNESSLKSSGNKFNAVQMAQYFQDSLFDAKWSTGFASVNIRAMSSQFAKWRKEGATAEQVTTMIDAYMREPNLRGKIPGWKDFLYRREQIANIVLAGIDSVDDPVEEWDEDKAMQEYLARRNK